MEHPSEGMGKNEAELILPHIFQAPQGTPWGKAGRFRKACQSVGLHLQVQSSFKKNVCY